MDLRDAVTYDRPEVQESWGGVEKIPLAPSLPCRRPAFLALR